MQKKAYGSRSRLNKHHNFASGNVSRILCPQFASRKVSRKTKPLSFKVSVTIATSAGHSTDP